MSIISTLNKSNLTIKITDSFNFQSHREFRTASDNIPSEATSVSIDITTIDYIDSSALGMLLILREKFSSDKDDIKIIVSNPYVKKILNIASFQKLFTIT